MHVSDFFDIGMAVINKFGNNTIAKNWLEELEIEQNDLIIIEVNYKAVILSNFNILDRIYSEIMDEAENILKD